MENSEKNRIRKEIEERCKQSRQALQQGDCSQVQRMFHELCGDPIYRDVLIEMLTERLKEAMGEATKRMLAGEQEPNIARCVLAIMEELRGINLWDESESTSYKRALEALEAYQRLEKKRVEFLATKAAYEKATQEYRDTKELLGYNLACKGLGPLGGGDIDPMTWYLTVQEVVKSEVRYMYSEDEESRKVHLSVSTLRKYQRLGLIPKPIRIGRKARYSLLTLGRIALIQAQKEAGIKLKDIESARIETLLKETMESCERCPQGEPPTNVQMKYHYMTKLIDKGVEERVKQLDESIDRSLDEWRATWMS